MKTKFLGEYRLNEDVVLPIVADSNSPLMFIDKGGEYTNFTLNVTKGENIIIPKNLVEQGLVHFSLKILKKRGRPLLEYDFHNVFAILIKKQASIAPIAIEPVEQFTIQENENGFESIGQSVAVWVQNTISERWEIPNIFEKSYLDRFESWEGIELNGKDGNTSKTINNNYVIDLILPSFGRVYIKNSLV